MSIDFVFSACMAFALFGWGALALAPVNRAYCIAFARGVALLLAVAYLAQLLFSTETVEGGSFWTIGGIALLFSAPANAMLGWTHYLVFDLFIGSWEVEDAAQQGLPHWIVIPCLLATLMVGPVGLLLYFIIRILAKGLKQQAPAPTL